MKHPSATTVSPFDRPSFLPIVAIIGLLFRLLLLFAVRHNVVFRDELDYEGIAVRLLHTHQFLANNGLPTAYRPPGESLFIAAIYRIFGQHPVIVKVVQELLLTTLPFLSARFARHLGMTAHQANLAALLAAFHPALAYAVTTLYPTALTAVALTVGILYSSLAMRGRTVREAVIGGLALGVTGILTTTFAPLAFLVGLYLLYKRQLRLALIIGILGTLPSLIWMVRNRVVMGSWVLATNGGFNLILGANDEASPMSGNWIEPPSLTGVKTELDYNQAFTRLASSWIRQHPGRWLKLCVARGLLIVDSVGRPNTKGIHSGASAQVAGWLMLPVVLSGVAGMALYRKTSGASLTAIALLLVVVSSAMTLVKPRFRFPCDPLLASFAVAAVVHARRSRRVQHLEDSSSAVMLSSEPV